MENTEVKQKVQESWIEEDWERRHFLKIVFFVFCEKITGGARC